MGITDYFLEGDVKVPEDIFFENGPVGCQLIHGFTANQNEVLPLGRFLASKGVSILIPSLPGHGTAPEDMMQVKWQAWAGKVLDGHNRLRATCREVFVCGMSMGGVLALQLAQKQLLEGVVAMAAAFDFPKWQKATARALKRVWQYKNKDGGPDIKDKSMAAELGSYDRYPIRAVNELFALVDNVRSGLAEVRNPLLLLYSKQDHTIPVADGYRILERVSSTSKELIELRESYHIITMDVEREFVWETVWAFIRQHSTLLKI